MLAAADSACQRRHPEETRVVATLATTAVAAVLRLVTGPASRDLDLKFN
jgi:hypothetical protein